MCIHVPARDILLYCIHTSPSRSIQTRSSENSKILFIKHQQRLGNTYHLKPSHRNEAFYTFCIILQNLTPKKFHRKCCVSNVSNRIPRLRHVDLPINRRSPHPSKPMVIRKRSNRVDPFAWDIPRSGAQPSHAVVFCVCGLGVNEL